MFLANGAIAVKVAGSAGMRFFRVQRPTRIAFFTMEIVDAQSLPEPADAAIVAMVAILVFGVVVHFTRLAKVPGKPRTARSAGCG